MRIKNLITRILGTATLTLVATAQLHAAGDHEGDHGHNFAFGHAVEGGEPDRSIEIIGWRFEGAGEVEFACHITGHYPAGMKGLININ